MSSKDNVVRRKENVFWVPRHTFFNTLKGRVSGYFGFFLCRFEGLIANL